MLTDCIDPEAGGWVREITAMSIPEILTFDFLDLGTIEEARLHWNSCPACRHEFNTIPTVMAQVGFEVEKAFKEDLTQRKDIFLAEKRLLLKRAKDAYPEIIAALVMAEASVHETLARVLTFGTHVYHGISLDFDPWDHAILSNCNEFICSLKSDVQHFTVAATLSFELFRPICERIGWSSPRGRAHEEVLAEAKEKLESLQSEEDYPSLEEFQLQLRTAIATSGLQPDVLWETIERAAKAYTSDLHDSLKENTAPATPRADLLRSPQPSQETTFVQAALEEWKLEFKREFENLQDSLKAGQMELVRLYEHNNRRASDYESDVFAQLGGALYSKLQESTQRGLQVAEYLYHDRSEPNYFHGAVMQMALAFENELVVRVVWPFVNGLLDAGVATYDAQRRSKYALIVGGRFPKRSMTLGNVVWYLKEDPVMRSKVSGLGFDTDAISKDAAWVSDARNKAAHELFCQRAVADNLRQRILSRDGILSRLHPTMTPA